mgnify:CR=1 FL=1
MGMSEREGESMLEDSYSFLVRSGEPSILSLPEKRLI